MVLIDTPVWIRFLMDCEPFVRELKRLLAVSEAAAHDLVHGELLIGDFGGRKNLLDDLRLKLWTADSRLSVVADEFGTGHQIPN